MAPADHTYRVRPASAADLPAVLTILTENQGRPSDPQQAVWERVLATTDLTVYLAETGAEAVGTASMLLMPQPDLRLPAHGLHRGRGRQVCPP